MKNNIINQTGRSMIEMLGVLAIVGVLSVGGIAGYSKAMQKYRTNKTIEQITQIANGVRTLYSGQKNYDGISTEYSGPIRKAKILPESAWESTASGAEPKNPFGGTYSIRSEDKSTAGDHKAFGIYLGSVPDDACIEILTQDWGGASSGLIAVGVSSGIYRVLYGCTGYDGDSGSKVACADKLPLSIDDAMDLCEIMDGSAVGPVLKFY